MVYATRSRIITRARSNSAPEQYTPQQALGASSHSTPIANISVLRADPSPDHSYPHGEPSVNEATTSGPLPPGVNEDLSSGPPGLSVKEDSSSVPLFDDESKHSLRLASYDSDERGAPTIVSDPVSSFDPLIKQEPMSVELSFAQSDGSGETEVITQYSTTSSSSSDTNKTRPVTPVTAAIKELDSEQLAYLKRRESAGIKILEPGDFTSESEPDHEINRPPSPEFPHVGKGKNVDPRNWGNVDFSEKDMEDLRIQNQILLSLQRPRIKPSGPKYFDEAMFPEDSSNASRNESDSIESLYTLGTRHIGSEHRTMPEDYYQSSSKQTVSTTPTISTPGSSAPEDDSVEYSPPATPVSKHSSTIPSTRSTPTPVPSFRKSFKTTLEDVEDDDDDTSFQARHVHYTPTHSSISVAPATITRHVPSDRNKASPSKSSDSDSPSSDSDSDTDSDSSSKQRKRSKEATRRKRAKAKAKAKVRDTEAKKRRAVTPLTDTLNERIRDVVQGKSKRHSSRDNVNKNKDPLMPFNQLAGGSHLAKILRKKKTPDSEESSSSSDSEPSDDSDSESSTSSSSSSSSSSDSDSTSNSDSSSRERKKRRTKSSKKGKKAKRHHKRKHSRKSFLKPEPPTVYDGRADVRPFQTFLEDSMDYVREGRVNKKLRVKKIARYLSGVAKSWYIANVADDVKDWRTQEFFIELYNHCFPPTFRMEQRRKLINATQGSYSVRQYVLRLNELFNTTGITRNREKVLKLWETLRPEIQAGLYRDNLNPETVSYKKLVEKSERIEMILSIEDSARRQTRDQKAKGNPVHHENKKPNRDFPRDRHSKPSGNNHASSPNKPGAQPQASGSGWKSKGNNKDQSRNDKRKPGLTPQQKADYREKGKCFSCGETGHVAHACPKAKVVPGFGNKPPGFKAASVKISKAKNKPEPKTARDHGISDIWSGSMSLSGLSFSHTAVNDDENSSHQPDLFEALFSTEPIGSATSSPTNNDMPPLQPLSDSDSDSDMPPLQNASDSDDEIEPITEAPHIIPKLNDSDDESELDMPPLRDISELDSSDEDDETSDSDDESESDLEDSTDSESDSSKDEDYTSIDRTNLQPTSFRPRRRIGDTPICSCGKRVRTLRHSKFDPNGPGYVLMHECDFPGNSRGHMLYHSGKWNHVDDAIPVPPARIGNLWDRGIEFILARSTPYPGEDRCVTNQKRSFSVYQSYDNYIVSDTRYSRELLLPVSDAINPNFPIVEWYARERAKDNNLKFNKMPDKLDWIVTGWNSYKCLGELDVDTVEAYLNMHAPWLGAGLGQYDRKRQRFWVLNSYTGDGFDINDTVLEFTTFLPRERVSHDLFDLAAWYEQKLLEVPDSPQWDMWAQGDGSTDSMFGFLKKIFTREPIARLVHQNRMITDAVYARCFVVAKRIRDQLSLHASSLCFNNETLTRMSTPPTRSRREETLYMMTEHLSVRLSAYRIDNWTINDIVSDIIARWYNIDIWLNLEQTYRFQRLKRSLCKELDGLLPIRSSVSSPASTQVHLGSVDFELAGAQIPRGKLPAIQRNASRVKEAGRRVPRTIIIAVRINGQPARALIDSGSMADLISTTLLDQLKLKRIELTRPLPLQLAVQGSRSKINWGTKARFQYQGIDEERYFDVANLSGYDLILGTPWLYQHRACVGFNDPKVVIGSNTSVPIQDGPWIAEVVTNATLLDEESRLAAARQEILDYAEPLFRKASETPLPPLRAINHTIPLIDENKIYPCRPAKCPEKFRNQWAEKRDGYLKTGRWEVKAMNNASPMMILPKIDDPTRIRVVCDFRPRNSNTKKLSSPIPDPQAIRRRVANAKFRSTMDGSDAFEQVRVQPDHVERTAMLTPDGVMISKVMQQGDCNAPATFQSIMYHMFSPYIGRWMDVYLDDIIVYSDSLEEHLEHLKIIIRILAENKFYLAERKMKLFAQQVKILGCIVDDDGIRMDPHKVDSVLKWPTPTNRDLLRGFLGSVGYLADDVDSVRIPMGVLSAITGDAVPFRWGYTEQRAFEDVKNKINEGSKRTRVPLDYSEGAPPVWLVTDGCATGIAGVVIQGTDWKTGNVAAYYSAKLSTPQQNYPVHEIEMLAGVETMLRYRDILQGQRFTWVTDHKGLTYLLNQKDLSGRQARWIEKLSSFDFDVKYVPGTENVLADALSRIYSSDARGTLRARSEYTYHDVRDNDILDTFEVTRPVLVGNEATAQLSAQAVDVAPMTLRERRPVNYSEKKEPAEVSESQAFARRMKGKFTLKGPKKPETRMEGGLEENIGQMNDSNTHPFTSTSRSNILDKLDEAFDLSNDTATPTTKVPSQQKSDSAVKNRQLKSAREDNTPNTSKAHAPDASKVSDPSISNSSTSRMRVEDRNQDDISNLSLESQMGQVQNEPGNSEPNLEGDSFLDIVSGGRVALDILEIVRYRYGNDTAFKAIVAAPKEFRNFEYTSDGILYLKVQDDILLLCIPDVMHKGRKVREIIIDEAHSLLAHLGSRKTLSYLRAHVWWKTMSGDVDKYCKSCSTCAQIKPDNQRPFGKLRPLGPPRHPWDVIGIDFMEPLPLSKNRDGDFDSLTVIVDHMTGMVHLVPGRVNYKARDVAELVFEHVYKLHGLPRSIVSDRDSKFTGQFWKRLNALVGTQLKMSSAFHPQTDGLTERANRTIEQMLRQCIAPNQKDWVSKLPAIEFAINLARSETTGYAPFFLNSGRLPRSMIWDTASKTEFPGVRIFAQRMKNAIIQAHDNILEARIKQTRDANRRRRPSPFEKDDLVYLSIKNLGLPKGTARKFVPKYIGPFKITENLQNESFRLALPARLKQRGIHDVFHSSLLRIHIPNDDRLFPGRAESQILPFDQFENEWAVDSITAHLGSGDDLMFRVKWKAGDETLLPLKDVEHLNALSDYLEVLGLDSIKDLKTNKVKSDVVPGDVDAQVIYAASVAIDHDREGYDSTTGIVLKESYQSESPAINFLTEQDSSTTSLPIHHQHITTTYHPHLATMSMSHPIKDLNHYNRHPKISVLGPNSLVIRSREGTYSYARGQVQAIVNDNVVLSEVGKTGIFPSGFTESVGADFLAKAFNRSPHFYLRFCTKNADGTINVPDNQPPHLIDLLPAPPPKITQDDVDRERMRDLELEHLEVLREKNKKHMRGKLISDVNRRVRDEVRLDLDARRRSARELLGKTTTIEPRGSGPYPSSTIPESRRDRASRKSKSTLNAKASSFVPSSPRASGSADTLDNYVAPEDDTEMAAPLPSA